MVLAAALLTGCSSAAPLPSVEPGPQRTAYTAADVQFMQHMISHHAQALVMAELVAARSSRADMQALAERVSVSQREEIAYMQNWLRRRNQEVPAADAHVHAALGHGVLMAGMLTQAELDRLAQARGAEFERLFLQYMIRHHEGALQMVRQLLTTPGSGQEAELFMFASDVDADQNAEISRMRALLAQLP